MPHRRDHSKRLRQFARDMRRQATDAERKLWRLLRGRRLAGAKFRRQCPIAGFIADFCCMEANLIVELDGGQHYEPEGIAYDAERTRRLNEMGCDVMRIADHELLKDERAVIERIHQWLEERGSARMGLVETLAPERPHPGPRPQAGEGEKRSPWPSCVGGGGRGSPSPHRGEGRGEGGAGRSLAIFAFVLISVVAQAAGAQVSLTSPVDGYGRVGKYTPLAVGAAIEGERRVILEREGALPVDVELVDGRAEGVVPWLILGPSGETVRWSAGRRGGVIDLPIHLLDARERLVGFTTMDLQIAEALFPEMSIVPVQLDPTAPLPGEAAAWEVLDAVVLDAPAAARIEERAWMELLAAGVVFAVRSAADTPPDQRWPWRREGNYWILRHDPAGMGYPRQMPARTAFNDLVYPPFTWPLERPASFRYQVVLLGLLVSILILGVALWRPRWTLTIAAVVVVAMMTLLAGWRAMQSPVLHRGGDILVLHEQVVQIDRFDFQTSLEPARAEMPWRGMTRPLFASQRHFERVDMALRCAADGRAQAFSFHLPRGVRLAFVSQTVEAEALALHPEPRETAPLIWTARHFYLRRGDRILGQIGDPPINRRDLHGEARRWPTVVVRREMP